MRATVKMLKNFICNIYKNTWQKTPHSSKNKFIFIEKHGIKAIVSNWWNPKQSFRISRRFWMKSTKNVHKKSITYIELMIFQVLKDNSRIRWRTKSDLEGGSVVKAFTVSWWVESYLKTSLCHSGGEFWRKDLHASLSEGRDNHMQQSVQSANRQGFDKISSDSLMSEPVKITRFTHHSWRHTRSCVGSTVLLNDFPRGFQLMTGVNGYHSTTHSSSHTRAHAP